MLARQKKSVSYTFKLLQCLFIIHDEPFRIFKRERCPFDLGSSNLAFREFSLTDCIFEDDSEILGSGDFILVIHCLTGLAFLFSVEVLLEAASL